MRRCRNVPGPFRGPAALRTKRQPRLRFDLDFADLNFEALDPFALEIAARLAEPEPLIDPPLDTVRRMIL